MRAVAPARVNLIGDHTDYTGGLVFPMAIDRFTTIDFEPSADSVIRLHSHDQQHDALIQLPVSESKTNQSGWARYIAAVAKECNATHGITGEITTTIPIGSGLSSSAALEVATALALNFNGSALELAQLARRAEHTATGVPTGIMDQLCIASAREQHAMLIDCDNFEIKHVQLPENMQVVVRFITQRTLEGSQYADRVKQCADAESIIGPLRHAKLDSIEVISDQTIRQRARHVITENQRVRDFALALQTGDLKSAGLLMNQSHKSLADDFATSTREMNNAVDELQKISGVYGARMTGGGFGGCVVALCSPDAKLDGWQVSAAGAAHLA